MAIERPKILTQITVPTGGWDLVFSVSDLAQYDTQLTATVAAGDYYMAWDYTPTDLVTTLAESIKTAMVGGGLSNAYCGAYIDSDYKINIRFLGTFFTSTGQDVKLEWTDAGTDVALAIALGFDYGSDDTATGADNPTFTADEHHGYGWYSDEDGWLEFAPLDDIVSITSPQAISISGAVSTQNLGKRFYTEVSLNWLTRLRTFSDEQAYGYDFTSTFINDPHRPNYGLQQWYMTALNGTPFRFYREGRIGTGAYYLVGSATSIGSKSITDSSKSWVDYTYTRKYKTSLVQTTSSSYDLPVRAEGQVNDSSVSLEGSDPFPGGDTWCAVSDLFYIIDGRYQTYVLDTGQMSEFRPNEIEGIDRFSITIPMLRYVS
jgi:hypothetical protein